MKSITSRLSRIASQEIHLIHRSSIHLKIITGTTVTTKMKKTYRRTLHNISVELSFLTFNQTFEQEFSKVCTVVVLKQSYKITYTK